MKKRDYVFIIITIGILAVLIIKTSIAIPCIFYKLTGLYCPGCGGTRAVRALFRGDIYLSFRDNMLLYIVFPLYTILEIFNIKTKRKYKKVYNVGLIFLIVIALVYAVLRNTPSFSYLAPMEK